MKTTATTKQRQLQKYGQRPQRQKQLQQYRQQHQSNGNYNDIDNNNIKDNDNNIDNNRINDIDSNINMTTTSKTVTVTSI